MSHDELLVFGYSQGDSEDGLVLKMDSVKACQATQNDAQVFGSIASVQMADGRILVESKRIVSTASSVVSIARASPADGITPWWCSSKKTASATTAIPGSFVGPSDSSTAWDDEIAAPAPGAGVRTRRPRGCRNHVKLFFLLLAYRLVLLILFCVFFDTTVAHEASFSSEVTMGTGYESSLVL